jgi:hypothetical protein
VFRVCYAYAGTRATRSFSTGQAASAGPAIGSSCSAPAAAGRRACRLAALSRGFSASACTATATDPSLSDVVAQVQSCVATSNKETGVLSQVGAGLCIPCYTACVSWALCLEAALQSTLDWASGLLPATNHTCIAVAKCSGLPKSNSAPANRQAALVRHSTLCIPAYVCIQSCQRGIVQALATVADTLVHARICFLSVA